MSLSGTVEISSPYLSRRFIGGEAGSLKLSYKVLKVHSHYRRGINVNLKNVLFAFLEPDQGPEVQVQGRGQPDRADRCARRRCQGRRNQRCSTIGQQKTPPNGTFTVSRYEEASSCLFLSEEKKKLLDEYFCAINLMERVGSFLVAVPLLQKFFRFQSPLGTDLSRVAFPPSSSSKRENYSLSFSPCPLLHRPANNHSVANYGGRKRR